MWITRYVRRPHYTHEGRGTCQHGPTMGTNQKYQIMTSFKSSYWCYFKYSRHIYIHSTRRNRQYTSIMWNVGSSIRERKEIYSPQLCLERREWEAKIKYIIEINHPTTISGTSSLRLSIVIIISHEIRNSWKCLQLLQHTREGLDNCTVWESRHSYRSDEVN